MSAYQPAPWMQKKEVEPQLREQGQRHTHLLLSVGIPSREKPFTDIMGPAPVVGHITFTCSSNPRVKVYAYAPVVKCPWCREHNPLKGRGENK